MRADGRAFEASVRSGEEAVVEQRGERERTDAEAALLEEVAARDVAQARLRARSVVEGVVSHGVWRGWCEKTCRYSFVTVSSRLNRTLATMVQAACSATSISVAIEAERRLGPVPAPYRYWCRSGSLSSAL